MQDFLQKLQAASELTASGPIAFGLLHDRLRADTILETLMVLSNVRIQITRPVRNDQNRLRLPEFSGYRNLRVGSTFI